MYYFFKSETLGGSDFIVTEDKLTWIPIDPENSQYQQYLAWVAEGNEAQPWV